MLLQLPQTTSYPVKVSMSIQLSPQALPHFPPAQHSKHCAHLCYYPLTYSRIFRSLPLTPQTPSPTNRELYSNQPDKHVQET